MNISPAGIEPCVHVGELALNELEFADRMAEAKKNSWIVISMKDDWKKIFAFEK